MHGLWKGKLPPEQAWKRKKGVSPSAEQDLTAGGRDKRIVALFDNKIAHASVALRLFPRTRRIRAYLRWSDKGKTREKYIGEVDEATREGNLKAAWSMAQRSGLVLPAAVAKNNSSWASSTSSMAVMRANRGRDTRPELALRSAVHFLGLRYRVGVRPIPSLRRTADLVFTRVKVAVFLDGCYWHGCEEHYRPSRRNSNFWKAKIDSNKTRDRSTDKILREAGWEIVRVWEHENVDEAAVRVAKTVRNRSLTHK